MNTRRTMLLLVIVTLATIPVLATAGAMADSGDSSGAAASTTPATPDPTVSTRPTQKTNLRYDFDAFGPYPAGGAAFGAGINQAKNAPPKWKRGAEGYSKRFVSNFGIAAISTTTRYALAQAPKEDTLYYRWECKGVFPRLHLAVISTLTGRRGEDGHRVFSFPALVAPYAGTMTAVYGWYPGRYSAKDALRMGNYTLLGHVGGNIALESLYGGPYSLPSSMHLNNGHGAPNPSSNP